MNAATQTPTPATPAKLRDGGWGARVTGSASRGDIVQITTRSGKTWQATVTRVLSSGGAKTLCATESLDRRPPQGGTYRPRRGVDYCGYPCPVDGHRCTPAHPCHDCA